MTLILAWGWSKWEVADLLHIKVKDQGGSRLYTCGNPPLLPPCLQPDYHAAPTPHDHHHFPQQEPTLTTSSLRSSWAAISSRLYTSGYLLSRNTSSKRSNWNTVDILLLSLSISHVPFSFQKCSYRPRSREVCLVVFGCSLLLIPFDFWPLTLILAGGWIFTLAWIGWNCSSTS